MTQEQWDINHRYEIAIRNMNPNGWAKMTENEKIENLQAIEDKNAMDVGRLPAEVMAEDMPEKQLGYQLDNTIVISRSSLAGSNFPEIIDSIYHEGSHIQDWQAGFLSEVRVNYTMEELEARSSPIPNSEHDWNGYWNHPAEQAARELGKAGVEKTLKDQMKIEDMDREVHFHGNQILETYDYLALQEIASSSQEFGMVAENVMFQEGVDYTEYSIESLPDDEVEYSLDDL